VPRLRAWQAAALQHYRDLGPRDFLAVATPGAGKTSFALTVAGDLLRRRSVDRIVIVAPTEHLKTQWAEAASAVGLAVDPAFGVRQGRTGKDSVGVALTYAGVAANPLALRIRTEGFKTLVILDEIHHAADALSWGDAVREAFAPAARRLMLTGTPFRSDTNPIPFLSYEPDGAGALRSRADYSYPYAQALADGIVRPVLFLAYSGDLRWRTRVGDEVAARLGEPLSKDLTAQALRTALDPQGSWIPAVLRAADTRLSEVRTHVPDAGGLVIASDQASARAYAELLGPSPNRSRCWSQRRRPGGPQHQPVRHQRPPVDGGGADGVGGRRRAPAGGRGVRHRHLDPPVLRPGGGPVRPGPSTGRDGLGVPAQRGAAAALRRGDGGLARPRPQRAGST